MNSKSLFSSFGLAAIAIGLLFSVLFISLLPSLRMDLTEDNLYSLSAGTRSIVSSLQDPIEIMFFYSDSATEDIPQIRSYGTRVQELLREIVIASNGNLRLTMIDPEPFSEEEDLATQYGIRAVPVTQGGEGVYFGLVATQDSDPEVPLQMRASASGVYLEVSVVFASLYSTLCARCRRRCIVSQGVAKLRVSSTP